MAARHGQVVSSLKSSQKLPSPLIALFNGQEMVMFVQVTQSSLKSEQGTKGVSDLFF